MEHRVEDSLELVHEVLKEEQLEQIAQTLANELSITRLAHFDHVKVKDLTAIGLSRPAARRLLAAVKRRRAIANPGYLSEILQKIVPGRACSRSASQTSRKSSIGNGEPVYANTSVTRDISTVSCLINIRDLTLKEKLGQGSFGEVLRAEWKKEDGNITEVAVKILKTDALALPGTFSDFVKEVNAMVGLKHPNLIKLHGVSLSLPYMIVVELAPLGSVLDRLRKECSLTSVLVILEWAKQICNGMAYLESHRWVHRDLAARNILLSAIDKVKIGDFGLMKSIEANEDCYVMSEHKMIPFPWCAPECLKLRKFSHASDCWAYGVTLWELFTFGEHPWAGHTGAQILQKIDQEGQRLPKPPACPQDVYQLVMHMSWSHREQDRPTFAALVKFFQGFELEILTTVKDFEEGAQSNALTPPLHLSVGDEIIVVDGRPENHWWVGQNKRTYKVGHFPRNYTRTQKAGIRPTDISKPLRHSFIHAGHGDIDTKKSFGNPAAIDDIFLKNPIPAQDVLGVGDPAHLEHSTTKPCVFPHAPQPLNNNKPTRTTSPEVNLLDLVNEVPQAKESYYDDFYAPFGSEFSRGTVWDEPSRTLPGNTEYSNSSLVASLSTPYTNTQYNYPPPLIQNSAQGSVSSQNWQVPPRPNVYGNVLASPAMGTMLLSPSNGIIPTVSPNYSPNTYYNTASYVVHPSQIQQQGPVRTQIPLQTNSCQPTQTHFVPPVPQEKFQNKQQGFFSKKQERVIHTVPISSLDTIYGDPFDTSAIADELWSVGNTSKKEPVDVGTVQLQIKSKEAPKDNVNIPAKKNEMVVPKAQTSLTTASSPGWTASDLEDGNSTTAAGSVLDDMVRAVRTVMPGESFSACQGALQKHHFDKQKAVNWLKVQRLLRLDMAKEDRCRKVLEESGWDLEKAGEALLNQS